MQPVDLDRNPMHNYISRNILEYTQNEHQACDNKLRIKQEKGRCGEKGERQWKRCRRINVECKQEAYEHHKVKRWLKIAACKCLDKPEKERNRLWLVRAKHCRTWRDFAGKQFGRYKKDVRNEVLLEAMKNYVVGIGPNSTIPTCEYLNYVENEVGEGIVDLDDSFGW